MLIEVHKQLNQSSSRWTFLKKIKQIFNLKQFLLIKLSVIIHQWIRYVEISIAVKLLRDLKCCLKYIKEPKFSLRTLSRVWSSKRIHQIRNQGKYEIIYWPSSCLYWKCFSITTIDYKCFVLKEFNKIRINNTTYSCYESRISKSWSYWLWWYDGQ